MIGKKQTSNNQDWLKEFELATTSHTFDEIKFLEESTCNKIISNADSQSMFGYSGGKDSIVLTNIANKCITEPNFISCILQNEYPSFYKWVKENCPKDCVFVKSKNFSLEFLNEHLDYLFPVEKPQQKAYVQDWNKPIFNFMNQFGYKKIFTGRRIQDGNFVGKKDCGVYTTHNKLDITSINPIADWTHSQLLAYIKYYDLELPEIYNYPNGFVFGTHPWTERDRVNGRFKDTFDEIMGIDESIVIDASKKLNIAKEYLDGTLNF